MDINNITLVGRLTRDIEIKTAASGISIGNASLAVNRRTKKGGEWTDEVSFFDVTMFGKTAENIAKYAQKGKQIAVSGELQQQRWEKDGQNRSKVVVIANQVQLIGGKSEGNSGGSDEYESIPF